MKWVRKYWFVLVFVLALTILATPKVVQMVKEGSTLGLQPPEDAKGGIMVSPQTLLDSVNAALAKQGKAPIDLDTLALARALRSEHGSETATTRAWVGWAIKNNAGSRSLFSKLTSSKNPTYSGFFARQRTDARYAATNQAPRLTDIEVAQMVIRGKVDPTRGATNFFSPAAQDALYKRKLAGDPSVALINRDGDAQRAKWISEGLLSKGTPPGVNPRTVEFFGKVA